MLNNKKKMGIAITVGLVFVLLSLPKSYEYIDMLVRPTGLRFTYDNCPGLPTVFGIVLNACLIAILVRILIQDKDITELNIPNMPEVTQVDFGYEYESEDEE